MTANRKGTAFLLLTRQPAGTRKLTSTASLSGMACSQQLTENAGGDARLSSCESKNLFQPVPRQFIPRAAVSQDRSPAPVAPESTWPIIPGATLLEQRHPIPADLMTLPHTR